MLSLPLNQVFKEKAETAFLLWLDEMCNHKKILSQLLRKGFLRFMAWYYKASEIKYW